MAVIMLLTTNQPTAHALFGRIAAEKERREQVERQLAQEQKHFEMQQHLIVEQQHRTNQWQLTAFILGIMSVVMLVAGTVIGSAGRRNAAK
jgi:hypothetical protein